MRRVIPGLLLILGLTQLSQAGWIHAKAGLAHLCLERAWRDTLGGADEVPPWPWADTWPIARLQAPGLDASMVVLEGASGRVLAFAPGWLHGSARPGREGSCVIAGHRDTHFAILEQLATGDLLVLQDDQGHDHHYRVASTAVVDHQDVDAMECDAMSCLVLVTCWPFDAIRPGGPGRYVVWAPEVAIEPTNPSGSGSSGT